MQEIKSTSGTTTGTMPTRCCNSCGTSFRPKLAYQSTTQPNGEAAYYCSLPCRAAPDGAVHCTICSARFSPTYAYQALGCGGRVVHVCSSACLTAYKAQRERPAPAKQHRTAVLNQKGGTGKTTTAVNLAAGLAEAGHHVLLIDADPQASVGASLGVRSQQTVADVLMGRCTIDEAVVPMAGNFDVLCSDDRLADAEISLAQNARRVGVLAAALEQTSGYSHVLIDCAPAISLVNQNALCACDDVLIPVSCDYLSLVGVRQVLKTIEKINKRLGHKLRISAVLPTFYDKRQKVCQESLAALQQHFGSHCLPPIRANTRLKEAPSRKRTIFEHAPDSYGAEDYRALVAWALRTVPVPVELPPLSASPIEEGSAASVAKVADTPPVSSVALPFA